MKTAKKVLKYLKQTKTLGITYTKKEQDCIDSFSDADRGSKKPLCKPISGYLFTLTAGAFSWISKQQSIVAQSYVEAEFVVFVFCRYGSIVVTEGPSITFPIYTICSILKSPRTILAASCFQKTNSVSEQSKHIDIIYYLKMNHKQKGNMQATQIATSGMVANMSTKTMSLP